MGIVKKAWEIWEHPDELVPMIRMFLATQQIKRLPKDPDLAFCYDILNKVSRSFAVVIQQLPESLRDAVCVFYLVLRALDTVEDDMGIPVDEKCPILKDFHSMIYSLETRYSYGVGEYRRLLKDFPKVVTVFKGLTKSQQDVIADITRRMGAGMAKFIEKEVETIAEYDEYCHYVAGLVGVGLSKLFSSSGVESPEFEQLDDLSNHMGLFLQKTNIIRDYLEDIMEEPAPRMFWPKEVWGPHAQSLEGFKEAENRDAAVRCLNHMVTNALRHAPFCLQYLSQLRHPMVFRFCAIPQIMAMRTLMMCYNNPTVFTGVVKMRRGETCKIFDILAKMHQVYGMFWDAASLMAVDAQVKASGDPVLKQTLAALDAIEAACEAGLKACAGYAWNVDSLRAGHGAMHRESVFNVLLDHFQRFLSLILLAAALVVAFRGKKL